MDMNEYKYRSSWMSGTRTLIWARRKTPEESAQISQSFHIDPAWTYLSARGFLGIIVRKEEELTTKRPYRWPIPWNVPTICTFYYQDTSPSLKSSSVLDKEFFSVNIVSRYPQCLNSHSITRQPSKSSKVPLPLPRCANIVHCSTSWTQSSIFPILCLGNSFSSLSFAIISSVFLWMTH